MKCEEKSLRTAGLRRQCNEACAAIEKVIFDVFKLKNIAFHLVFTKQNTKKDCHVFNIQNQIEYESNAFELMFGYFAQFISELSGDTGKIDMDIVNQLLQDMKEHAAWCAENPSVFHSKAIG